MYVQKLTGITKSYAFKFVMSDGFAYSSVLAALLLTIIIVAPAFAMTQVSADRAHIEKLYVESNGTEHVYGFKLCAGDEPLYFAKVVVTSDSDIVIMTTDKIIKENMCRVFGVNITANDADSIHSKLVEPIRA